MGTYIMVVYRHLSVFVYTISPSVTPPAVLPTVVATFSHNFVGAESPDSQHKFDVSWLTN